MALPRLTPPLRGTSALALAAGALLVLACSGTGGSFVVDQADKDVLFTIEDLDALAGTTSAPGGTFSKTRDFDGAWNLEYEYEADDTFVITALFMENDADSAGWVMVGASFTEALVSGDATEFVPDPSLCPFGDEQRCGHLRTAGIDFGVVCTVRQNATVAMVAVGGADLDGALDCTKIVGPMLAAAKTHVPAETPLEP